MDRNMTLLLVSMAFMGLTRLFKDDLPLVKTWPPMVRSLILAVLAAGAGAVDMMTSDGTTLAVAFQTALKTAGPGVVLLLVEWIGSFGGGGTSGGASAGDGTKTSLPPGVPNIAGVKMEIRDNVMRGGGLVFGLALALTVLPGCAAFQKADSQLPAVIADIQEVQAVVDALEAAAQIFLASNQTALSQVEKAYADVETGLAALNDTAVAVADGAKGDVASAMASAQRAFSDFENLLRQLGVVQADGKFAVVRTGSVERVSARVPRLMARK